VLNHLFPTGCGDAGGAHRLMIARGSPTYLSAVVPGTRMLACRLLVSAADAGLHLLATRDLWALTAAAADSAAPQWFATDHARYPPWPVRAWESVSHPRHYRRRSAGRPPGTLCVSRQPVSEVAPLFRPT
jgi:hypothetical protein